MSRISQDFIKSVGSLYEEINIQQQDFLNEESEHYDAEAAELVEEILATISTSMVYEGYSAEGIIGFLADSSEQDIVEKYLSFDENILTESTISEDYIAEQLEIFDVAINEGIGSLVGKSAMGAAKLIGRIASKPARMKAAARLATSNNPARTAAAYQKLANKNVAKAGFTPPSTGGSPASFRFKNTDAAARAASMSKVVGKVKDIAKGAKAALTSPTAKKVALGAAGLGAAGLAGGIGGYMGAKLAGAGSGSKPTASPQPAETKPTTPAKPSSKPSGSGGGGGAGTGASGTPAKPKAPAKDANQQYKDLIKAGKTKEAEKAGLEAWAKANPKLAAKLKSDGTQKGTGESEMEKGAEELRKMQNTSKQRQGTLMGGPEGPGKVDTKAADDALKADQERQIKKMKEQNKTPVTAKESYEPYDVVLNYLLSEGHADTLDEANYIMLEMDENTICTIVEEYNDYLLAEEIQEWVNDLVEEGYDLSQYTWDDMVEYYVNEARVDVGKTDDEKQEARRERGNSSFTNILSRRMKKSRGKKPLDEPGKNRYSTMQHNKNQAQRERDADEQRSRDRGGMSRGTWDKN